MRQPVHGYLAALFAALLVACAGTTGAGQGERRRALDNATVSRAPAALWPEVLRFLHERGYPLLGADQLAVGEPGQASGRRLLSYGFPTRVRSDGGRVLETDPKADTRTRVRVEATPAQGGGSHLRVRMIQQVDMSTVDTTEFRDPELERALLARLEPPAVPARSRPPAPAPATPPSGDRWVRVRPLLGSWLGKLADGEEVRWRFELAVGAAMVEMRGTALLFAGSAPPAAGEELGRIAFSSDGERLVWNQLTSAGRVDRYEAAAAPGAAPAPGDPLVFVAQAPESLPTGARARLTLRRSGDALEAALDIAQPGGDFTATGALRLTRVP